MAAEKLPHLLRSIPDLKHVVHDLPPAQCAVLFESIHAHLPNILTSPIAVRTLLIGLSPERSAAICGAMQSHLLTIILSHANLASMMHYQSPAQCTAIFEALPALLAAIMTSSLSVGELLCLEFSMERRIAMFEAIQASSLVGIRSRDAFYDILSRFSTTACTLVCESLRADGLKTVMPCLEDFIHVLHYLPPDKCAALCAAMDTYAKDLIAELMASIYYALEQSPQANLFNDRAQSLTTRQQAFVTGLADILQNKIFTTEAISQFEKMIHATDRSNLYRFIHRPNHSLKLSQIFSHFKRHASRDTNRQQTAYQQVAALLKEARTHGLADDHERAHTKIRTARL